jgi:DNA primase
MRFDAVQTIKEQLTMRDVLLRYGYDSKKRMPCPIHCGQDDNFEVKERSWHCYSHCGSGDVISFVQKVFGLSFSDALRKLDEDFRLGIYETVSNRKGVSIAKQAYKRKKQAEQKKREREDLKRRYSAAYDEWARLQKNKALYAPKTPDEEWHPLFVEAVQKLTYQEYLLECVEMEVYENERRNK